MTSTRFVPASGYTRVAFGASGTRDTIVVTEDGLATDDPAVIAACEAHPFVTQAAKKAKPADPADG